MRWDDAKLVSQGGGSAMPVLECVLGGEPHGRHDPERQMEKGCPIAGRRLHGPTLAPPQQDASRGRVNGKPSTVPIGQLDVHLSVTASVEKELGRDVTILCGVYARVKESVTEGESARCTSCHGSSPHAQTVREP